MAAIFAVTVVAIGKLKVIVLATTLEAFLKVLAVKIPTEASEQITAAARAATAALAPDPQTLYLYQLKAFIQATVVLVEVAVIVDNQGHQ